MERLEDLEFVTVPIRQTLKADDTFTVTGTLTYTADGGLDFRFEEPVVVRIPLDDQPDPGRVVPPPGRTTYPKGEVMSELESAMAEYGPSPEARGLACPKCWSLEVLGHVVRGVYDGVLWWSCEGCGHGWARWDDGVGRRSEQAVAYAEAHNDSARYGFDVTDSTLDPAKTAEMVESGHQVWVWMAGAPVPRWEIRGTGARF